MAPSTSFSARFQQSITPNALRAYLAEFISISLSAGSAMSSKKLMPSANPDPSGLAVVALANGFGLASTIYMSANIAGGHVNPAVTFGRVIECHLPILNAIFYWISQIIGSVMACLLLKVFTVNQNVVIHSIPQEMTGFGASVLEGVLTFGMVNTVYVMMDPRQGRLSSIGPIVIGLTAGANVLAAGPFSGGSVNPASAFGSGAIGGSFRNQAAYWIGPLMGAPIARLLDCCMIMCYSLLTSQMR